MLPRVLAGDFCLLGAADLGLERRFFGARFQAFEIRCTTAALLDFVGLLTHIFKLKLNHH
jgi:hypothetical protein